MSGPTDSLNTRKSLTAAGKSYDYFSLTEAAKSIGDISRLPFSLKVLLENLLRFEDGGTVTTEDVQAVADWQTDRRSNREIAFRPARVLMQDFTGVPAVVDLAAMREAVVRMGGDGQRINPLVPVDLVIDHSVMVDKYGAANAFADNVKMEYERNRERYEFLRWGSQAFQNFRVVPPGTGICHQVNLECLGQTVWTAESGGAAIAYPDTVVGTDSHTTMINGLAVLGWGVGGIEAEAAMLGQPISMLIPEAIGFKLTGALREGATATDLVLTVTQMLRRKGVVGKFVEFFGDGLSGMSLADRATIANMAPEYGATCGFFPIDSETIRYLDFTGRDGDRVALAEEYAKAQGMWRADGMPDPIFTDTLELDIGTVEPCLAGPKRPQDKIPLSNAKSSFHDTLTEALGSRGAPDAPANRPIEGRNHRLDHGAVAIAAITSCTNTSNPSVMLAAGLVARNAAAKGLTAKPWVKTSLAPGSQVVTDYLEKAGLMDGLNAIGFNLVGYGCTTCIGNSGPLAPEIHKAITDGDLCVAAILSGNRNFEGRVHPLTKANYLASPPLVVAYALAGSMTVDLLNDPIGRDKDGADIFLKDIWPSNREIQEMLERALTRDMFRDRYADLFKGDARWRRVDAAAGQTFNWSTDSTYVQNPPFFEGLEGAPGDVADILGARPLAILGDSITTDHISPAGSIAEESPAGRYLLKRRVQRRDFNSYGSRRGNHEVMMRGAFANIRIRNEMAPGAEGGFTTHQPSGEAMSIYDAAMRYAQEGAPLAIVAGKEYGTGSSRDWAAKGTRLLGVKAVIAESFERIHRSNLIGMGVLPLQFKQGDSRSSLDLKGDETFEIAGMADGLRPRMEIAVKIAKPDGSARDIAVLCRIDTLDEVAYYKNGGILQYVLRNMMADAA